MKSSRLQTRRNDKTGYLMSLPYVLYFGLFIGFPLLFSFILVFHKWNIVTPMQWIGLRNFYRLFHDVQFFISIRNTLVFLAIHIPLQITLALLLAVLLNQKIKFRGFFRALYFLPVIVSGVVITILWQQLYAYETGLLNLLLMKLGFSKIPWLIDSNWAMPSIAIMATWKNVGLYIVLFLVGLQGIPRYLYEAAEIDGARPVQQFFHITLPALNSTMVLVVILSTIGGFSLFIEPFVMTGGGPMNSTLSAMLYIYNQAFYFGHMGYAATLGFFFALIILLVVLFQKNLSREKINEEDFYIYLVDRGRVDVRLSIFMDGFGDLQTRSRNRVDWALVGEFQSAQLCRGFPEDSYRSGFYKQYYGFGVCYYFGNSIWFNRRICAVAPTFLWS
jgi:ABC-type sugar transport system permease subunit